MGKFILHVINEHGKLIGTYDNNPILNSHLYEVEFTDGEVKYFAANIILESCMLQVESNSHHYQLLDCITNVRCDDQAIAKSDGYNTTKREQHKRCETTVGWNFDIKWKDGTKK